MNSLFLALNHQFIPYNCKKCLHGGNHKEVGKVDTHRKFKYVKIVCEMPNKVDNEGGQAFCQKRTQKISSKY